MFNMFQPIRLLKGQLILSFIFYMKVISSQLSASSRAYLLTDGFHGLL